MLFISEFPGFNADKLYEKCTVDVSDQPYSGPLLSANVERERKGKREWGGKRVARLSSKRKIAEPLVRGLSPTPLLSAAQCCLTSQSGQDEVWPAWYERDRW